NCSRSATISTVQPLSVLRALSRAPSSRRRIVGLPVPGHFRPVLPCERPPHQWTDPQHSIAPSLDSTCLAPADPASIPLPVCSLLHRSIVSATLCDGLALSRSLPGAAMQFSILGPLLAEADDGTPLPLVRPSQRATLAVLLVHAAQPATKTTLIEALWGDSPPKDADTALRVRMRDVRRGLAGHDRIETHVAGYQISVKPGELDADNFRTMVGHGRAALDSGNAENGARL